MAITKLSGNDYIVFIDTTTSITEAKGAVYRPVMCASTNGFNGTRETIDVADKCSGGWATPLSGTGSWTITGTGNAIDESANPSADSYQELFSIWKAGDPIWVKIANASNGTGTAYVREGVAILTDYAENQDTDAPFTFDFTFTGVGEVSGTVTT